MACGRGFPVIKAFRFTVRIPAKSQEDARKSLQGRLHDYERIVNCEEEGEERAED